MASCLVVGLFRSSGIALDAVHRLVTEGMSPREVARGVLKEARLVPPTLEPELAALQVDPVIIEDSRPRFAQYIRNGETAVFVRARSDEQVEFASGVLKQYLPITIEVVPLSDKREAAGAR